MKKEDQQKKTLAGRPQDGRTPPPSGVVFEPLWGLTVNQFNRQLGSSYMSKLEDPKLLKKYPTTSETLSLQMLLLTLSFNFEASLKHVFATAILAAWWPQRGRRILKNANKMENRKQITKAVKTHDL